MEAGLTAATEVRCSGQTKNHGIIIRRSPVRSRPPLPVKQVLNGREGALSNPLHPRGNNPGNDSLLLQSRPPGWVAGPSHSLFLVSRHGLLGGTTRAHSAARHICEKCGTRPAIEVSHLTYLRVFQELPSELVALCRQCHSEIHWR